MLTIEITYTNSTFNEQEFINDISCYTDEDTLVIVNGKAIEI